MLLGLTRADDADIINQFVHQDKAMPARFIDMDMHIPQGAVPTAVRCPYYLASCSASLGPRLGCRVDELLNSPRRSDSVHLMGWCSWVRTHAEASALFLATALPGCLLSGRPLLLAGWGGNPTNPASMDWF